LRIGKFQRLSSARIVKITVERYRSSDNHYPENHLSDCRVQNNLPPFENTDPILAYFKKIRSPCSSFSRPVKMMTISLDLRFQKPCKPMKIRQILAIPVT